MDYFGVASYVLVLVLFFPQSSYLDRRRWWYIYNGLFISSRPWLASNTLKKAPRYIAFVRNGSVLISAILSFSFSIIFLYFLSVALSRLMRMIIQFLHFSFLIVVFFEMIYKCIVGDLDFFFFSFRFLVSFSFCFFFLRGVFNLLTQINTCDQFLARFFSSYRHVSNVTVLKFVFLFGLSSFFLLFSVCLLRSPSADWCPW